MTSFNQELQDLIAKWSEVGESVDYIIVDLENEANTLRRKQ